MWTVSLWTVSLFVSVPVSFIRGARSVVLIALHTDIFLGLDETGPGKVFLEVRADLFLVAEGLVAQLAVEVLFLLQLTEGTSAQHIAAVSDGGNFIY